MANNSKATLIDLDNADRAAIAHIRERLGLKSSDYAVTVALDIFSKMLDNPEIERILAAVGFDRQPRLRK
jgi:DNA-binding transcriptional regulator YiaG